MRLRGVIVAIGITLLGLVAWGAWTLRESRTLVPVPPPETQASAAPEGLGAELYELAQDAAPTSYVPQTNPFTRVETNPLRGVYTNPFSR